MRKELYEYVNQWAKQHGLRTDTNSIEPIMPISETFHGDALAHFIELPKAIIAFEAATSVYSSLLFPHSRPTWAQQNFAHLRDGASLFVAHRLVVCPEGRMHFHGIDLFATPHFGEIGSLLDAWHAQDEPQCMKHGAECRH